MRVIPVVCLGTYYRKGSPVASDDAAEMREFVYHAKANRHYYSTIGLRHPSHPKKHLAIRNPQEAWRASAEMLCGGGGGRLWDMALQYMKRAVPHPVLVPIPASCTTASSIDGRWAARGFAEALAAQGIGRVVLALVQKVATEPTHGRHVPASELYPNLEWFDGRIRPHETVVYVDDVLTRGYHIAAQDSFMGRPAHALGITVATTDIVERPRAIQARIREVRLGREIDDVKLGDIAEDHS